MASTTCFAVMSSRNSCGSVSVHLWTSGHSSAARVCTTTAAGALLLSPSVAVDVWEHVDRPEL